MSRQTKDWDWTIEPGTSGKYSWEGATVSVLMDIRDELKSLNRLLHCNNFLSIPRKLEQIKLNTTKRKIRRKKKRLASA